MRLDRSCCVLAMLAWLLAVPAGARAQSCLDAPRLQPKVTAGLRSDLAVGTNRFWVWMAEQADVSGAIHRKTKVEKTRYVYEHVRAVADRTQPPVLERIRAVGLQYRAHYVANAILVYTADDALIVDSHPEQVCAVAAMPQVALVDTAQEPQVIFEEPHGTFDNPGPPGLGLAWNLNYIHVPEVWAQGVTGQGIVVANIDTGVKWDHPLLKSHYRGAQRENDDTPGDEPGDDADDEGQPVQHDHNWWDAIHDHVAANNPCGASSPFPCDDVGHGTHTMGTMVGDDGAGTMVGAAPDATWIACRGFNKGKVDADGVLECLEFLLAPWDRHRRHADPAKAPDIISNSYGMEDRPWNLHAFQNLSAAGIALVGAAGNSAFCRSIIKAPAIYAQVITVGALGFKTDNIAFFSSKGPGIGRYNLQKPDVVVPGQNIPSADYHGFVAMMSGTSMSTPLVAGAVALAWSANRALIGHVPLCQLGVDGTQHCALEDAETNDLVRQTARPVRTFNCLSPHSFPNYVYGYGIVDALQLVEAAKQVKIDRPRHREAGAR